MKNRHLFWVVIGLVSLSACSKDAPKKAAAAKANTQTKPVVPPTDNSAGSQAVDHQVELGVPSSSFTGYEDLLVSDAKVIANPNYSLVDLQSIADELKSCGFSLSSSLCLDSHLQAELSFNSSFEAAPDLRVASTLFHLNTATADQGYFNFIVEIQSPNTASQSVRVGVYSTTPDSVKNRGVSKSDYLSKKVVPLIDVTIPSDAQAGLAYALKTLANKPNERALFSMSTAALNLDKSKTHRPEIVSSVQKGVPTVLAGSQVYQMAMLDLLRKDFNQETLLMEAYANALKVAADADVSSLAAATSVDLGDKSSDNHDKIVKGLKSNSSLVGSASAKALGEIDTGLDDENLLIASMESENYGTAAGANLAVHNLKITAAHLPALSTALLNNNTPAYNTDLIQMIAQIPGQDANATLIAALGKSDYATSDEANKALGKRTLNNEDLPAFRKMLAASDYGRYSAATLLGKIKTPESLVELSKLAQHDSSAYVRQIAIQTISGDPSPAAQSVLIAGLGDSDYNVSSSANDALQTRSLSNADLPAFHKVLSESSGNGHYQTATLLGKIQTPESLAELRKVGQSDSSSYVRQVAMESIAKDPSHDATAALIAGLADPDYSVTDQARSALSSRKLGDADVALIAQILVKPDHMYSAVELLGRIETADSTRQLISILGHSCEQYIRDEVNGFLDKRTLTADDLPTINTARKTAPTENKGSIAKLVGRVGNTEAVVILGQMAGDDDWNTRYEVALALKTISSDDATTILIGRLGESKSYISTIVIEALSGRKLNDAHVSLLISLVASSNWSVRYESVKLLGTTSSQKALDILKDRLVDETDGTISDAIRASIQAIKKRLAG